MFNYSLFGAFVFDMLKCSRQKHTVRFNKTNKKVVAEIFNCFYIFKSMRSVCK